MKFTLHWLKDFLQTDANLEQICQTLTHIGLEVEGVEHQGAKIKDLIIAKVVSAEKHPNADKLKLCHVTDGKNNYQVVCGAPNARTGIMAVMALPGTVIPYSGETLSKGVIRGVESQAMLCSERELEVSDEHDGIIILPDSAPLGGNYADFLGYNDVVIEIKLTPNRGDCLGVYGIARDLAAAGIGTLIRHGNFTPIKGTYKSPIEWTIAEDNNACKYVKGRHFKVANNGHAPQWMQKRLKAVGAKSISTLVDITNYVSLSYGRPLHVFSANTIQGGLTMRHARDGETCTALDGKEYKLTPSMTIIADERAVHSIGGIMGGMDSGCQIDSSDIFLEVAYFTPMEIAKTGRALNILSDARYRFERAVPTDSVDWGMDLASQMILELCGGTCSEITTAGAMPDLRVKIAFDNKRLAQHGGLAVNIDNSKDILTRLGCDIVGQDGDILNIKTPHHRPDIEGPHCIEEEILRINGFDKIPAQSLPMPHYQNKPTIPEQLRRHQMARRIAAVRGFNEIISWSFTKPHLAEEFGGNGEKITLLNPINSELNTMRPSILCNLLLALGDNLAKYKNPVHLFELGPVFSGIDVSDNWRDKEWQVMGMVRTGATMQDDYTTAKLADIFTIKRDGEEILQNYAPGVQFQVINGQAPAYYHPGRSAVWKLGAFVVGYFGQLHPNIQKMCDAPHNIMALEIFTDKLPKPKMGKGRARNALNPQIFQPIGRDFAFVLDANTPADDIIKTIKKTNQKYIATARVFDLYQGDKLPAGKKSLAIRVVIQPTDQNLDNDAIHDITNGIITAVCATHNAQLRQ